MLQAKLCNQTLLLVRFIYCAFCLCLILCPKLNLFCNTYSVLFNCIYVFCYVILISCQKRSKEFAFLLNIFVEYIFFCYCCERKTLKLYKNAKYQFRMKFISFESTQFAVKLSLSQNETLTFLSFVEQTFFYTEARLSIFKYWVETTEHTTQIDYLNHYILMIIIDD